MTYAGKQRLVDAGVVSSAAAVTAATLFTFTVSKEGGASDVCVTGNNLALKLIDFSKMVPGFNFLDPPQSGPFFLRFLYANVSLLQWQRN